MVHKICTFSGKNSGQTKQKRIQKIGICLLIVLITVSFFSITATAANLSASSINAQGAIVVDATTGETLWSKNADTELVPASLTKIMTAYLVYEAMDAGQFTADSVVPISSAVSSFSKNTVYSNVPLNTTEAYTVDELMDAMIITSACAATQALAEMVSGTEADFVERMNNTAGELGIDCYFCDCYGGSAENRVTARGLAALSYRLVSEYPDYLRHSQKTSYTFHGKTYTSTNLFLNGTYTCNGTVNGMKTGTTSLAGKCLVASAYNGNANVISVVLKSTYDSARYNDTKLLLNYGLATLDARLASGWQYVEPIQYTIEVGHASTTVSGYTINGELYVVPNDVAAILSGTSGCFSINDSADDKIVFCAREAYSKTGTEFAVIDGTTKMAAPCGKSVYVNGSVTDICAYYIDEKVYIPLERLLEQLGSTVMTDKNSCIATVVVPGYAEPFVDVWENEWYSTAVRFVYDNEIMIGTSETTFEPDETLTRAMTAKLLYNLEGSPQICDEGSSFTDVEQDSWYYDAVEWAAKMGLVKGRGNGKFDPTTPISRQELVTVLYRYAEYKNGDDDITAEGDLSMFSDAAQISEYALEPVRWATAKGIINGMGDGTFSPGATASRAQTANVMMKFMNAA